MTIYHKRKKLSPKIIITLITFIALLVASSTILLVSANTPENTTKRAVKNLANQILDVSQLEKIEKLVNYNTFYHSFNNPEINSKGTLYTNNSEIVLKDFFLNISNDEESNKLPFNNINFDLVLNNNLFYIKLPEKENGYAVVFDGFKEDFEKSVFHPDSNTKYSIEPSLYEQLLQSQENESNYYKSLKRISNDIEKIVNKAIKKAIDVFFNNVNIEKHKTSGNKVLEITLLGGDIYNMYSEIYRYLYYNKSIIKLLEKHEDEYKLILFGNNEAQSGQLTFSIKGAYQSILESVDEEVRQSLKIFSTIAKKHKIKLTMTMKNNSTNITELYLTYNNKPLINLDFNNESLKDTNKMSFYKYNYKNILADESYLSFDAYIIDKFSTKDKTTYSYSKNGQLINTLEIKKDNTNVNYNLSDKKGKNILSIDKVHKNDEMDFYIHSSNFELNLSFYNNKKDKYNTSDYINILKLSEEEIDEILKKLKN